MKLLDMMAAGVPSVCTTLGARGLDFDEGQGAFRRDDPDRFAEALVGLLTDDELWTDTVHQGQRYVAEEHTDARLLAEIESAVATAIALHSRQPRRS